MLASGSTSKSAGGIRAQFADELNIRIALRSLDEFEAMADEIAFRQDGYLFLLDREDDVATFRAALALQQSLGVPSRELTPAEAAEIVPQLSLEGVLAATYCPRDGYATPESVVQHYARDRRDRRCCRAARRPGSTCATAGSRRCRHLAAASPRTPSSAAPGMWSKEVGALAGVELPVEGEARSMWFTPEDGGLPARVPLTIDFSTGFYFHREGPGLAFGGRERTLEDVAEAAARRLPVLADLPVQSSWWGWYDVSPDWNALVGEAREAVAVPVRDRLLRARLPAGAGGRRAPRGARRRPRADARPLARSRSSGSPRGAERPETFVV